ncbi:MAG: hypothetical protein ACYC63_00465 [Armatimonadota bacterium]
MWRPHKPIFLIALARLYEEAPGRPNEFPLDDQLEEAFNAAASANLPQWQGAPMLIEHPFYHLVHDGFWHLTFRPGMEAAFRELEQAPDRRLTKSRLCQTVAFGSLDPVLNRCLRDIDGREAVLAVLLHQLGTEAQTDSQQAGSDAPSVRHGAHERPYSTEDAHRPQPAQNPFVSYLNSLHSRDAGSENALAEAQATNPFFGTIQVPHPLVSYIERLLLGDERCHVILSGHAGDGKSTIALQCFKLLQGLDQGETLRQGLRGREDLHKDGLTISLIKDLSEWHSEERGDLIAEMFATQGPRFLLVSNSGTLLAAFRQHEQAAGRPRAETENRLLAALADPDGEALEIGATPLRIINLAMVDNLTVAGELFRRLLQPEQWAACLQASCGQACPILRNVSLMQQNQDLVHQRLLLAYRRMHEYSSRLTLRQLSAHLAYIITAGLSCREATALADQPGRSALDGRFMFFNRFFGDDGEQVDSPALQLRAIRAAREQGFGRRLSAVWERRLWQSPAERDKALVVAGFQEGFEALCAVGAARVSSEAPAQAAAREQARRALFFLDSLAPKEGSRYLTTYLNSPMILQYTAWQNEGAQLEPQEKALLLTRLFHVLQEHFAGVRLPEGRLQDGQLYITLSRRSGDVRQSAQVVLARVSTADLDLVLRRVDTCESMGWQELQLAGRHDLRDLRLPLALPFLDYVMLRQQGEISGNLQACYSDRLERLKGQLLKKRGHDEDGQLMLIRLRTNHTFRQQTFAVRQSRLEVIDG